MVDSLMLEATNHHQFDMLATEQLHLEQLGFKDLAVLVVVIKE